MGARRLREGGPRRWLLPALALLVLAAIIPLTAGYRALCAGPFDTYPILAEVRTQARQAVEGPRAAEQAGERQALQPAPLDVARFQALDLLLQVKQADPVAFPAHAVAGAALEIGGCPVAASADQWRKAAAHAWVDPAGALAADGLARTLGRAAGADAVRATLLRYAAANPWQASNIERTLRAYFG